MAPGAPQETAIRNLRGATMETSTIFNAVFIGLFFESIILSRGSNALDVVELGKKGIEVCCSR